MFTSADDYMNILKDYKKFSQDFRRRIIDAGLLEGAGPKKTNDSNLLSQRRSIEALNTEQERAKTARNLVSNLLDLNFEWIKNFYIN